MALFCECEPGRGCTALSFMCVEPDRGCTASFTSVELRQGCTALSFMCVEPCRVARHFSFSPFVVFFSIECRYPKGCTTCCLMHGIVLRVLNRDVGCTACFPFPLPFPLFVPSPFLLCGVLKPRSAVRGTGSDTGFTLRLQVIVSMMRI